MSLVLRRAASAAVLATFLGALGFACGGSQGSSAGAQNAAPVKLAPAPDLGIAVHVEAASEDGRDLMPSVTTQLKSAMTAAGYHLIEGDGKKAEVKAVVQVNATEQPSMFVVMVNGKQKKTFKVELAASFVAASDGSVVDQATSSFTTEDGTVPSSAINALLGQVSTSGKLVAFSEGQKANVAKAEDDLWKAANADGCTNAKKHGDCDGVKAYIAKYPAGKYTADGRKSLQDSDGAIAKLAEDELWAKAAVDQCQKPAKSYDCKGVEDYLAKYAAGSHANDGRAALKASEKAREALKKKEDANAKKASFDECVKDCKREYERAYPGAFELLVARCTQNECK